MSIGDDVLGRLSDRAYRTLEAMILCGQLEPGDRLNEPALARQLGVSRGPLREAIQRLEGRKLVKKTAHLGAAVVKLSQRDLQEIFQIREVQEGLACRLATEAMTDFELDDLEQFLIEAELQLNANKNKLAQFTGAGDPDFHRIIISSCGNSLLIDALLGELYPLMRVYRFRSSRSRGRIKQALREHRAIIGAMRTRDVDRAEMLMRTHIRNARINLCNEERRPQEAAAQSSDIRSAAGPAALFDGVRSDADAAG